MRTYGKSFRFALFLFLSWTVSGCVYYNTFYNARKLYRQAEKNRLESDNPRSRIPTKLYLQYYMAAIKKASAVLDLYPTSKWVDDSLLLIGKSYYWRGEYSEALIKFQELQENFPKSEWIPESLYWQGQTLWADGQINNARTVLKLLNETFDENLFRRSKFTLAQIQLESGNYEEAIYSYRKLLEILKKKDKLQAQTWQGIGNSLIQLERYDEAFQAYLQVLASTSTIQTNFETRIQMGNILELQGKLDEAMKVYNDVLKIKRLKIYEAETQLKQANIFRLKVQFDRAMETYQKVIQRNPRTEYSAEAYYSMGQIEQKHRKNSDQAKEFYEKATKEKYGSDPSKLAQKKQKDLAALAKYRNQIKKQEGTVQSLPALFNLAELYLFNLSEPDSALAVYQQALKVSDNTNYAPKALYAIGLIFADSLKNVKTAQKVFQNLIESYPVTPYAIRARERIEHQRTEDNLAEARFLEAENLKEKGNQGYLNVLEQVITEYPENFFAAKALYTLAWTYENNFKNLDKAKKYYQRLVDKYPLTTFSEVANQKLKGGFLKLTETNPSSTENTSLVAQDRAARVTPTETEEIPTLRPNEKALTFSEVNMKPRIREAPSDEFLREVMEDAVEDEMEERRGKIFGRNLTLVVKVLIGKKGQVKDAKVIKGQTFLHKAALRAAKEYHFWPGNHQGKPREVWMDIDIYFPM